MSYSDHPASQASSGKTGARTWRDALPEDLREDADLARFQDIPALARSFLDLERRMAKAAGAGDIPGPDSDDADWDRLFDRLGRPRDPVDYDVPDERPGVPRQPEYIDAFRRVAHRIGLLPGQVRTLVAFHDELCDDARTRLNGHAEHCREELRNHCRQRFGASRIEAARKAVRDKDPDAFDWLESNALFDSPHVMAMLTRLMPAGYDGAEEAPLGTPDQVGNRAGAPDRQDAVEREDAIERPTGGRFALSSAEAEMEIDRLRADKDFLEAYLTRQHPGHDQAVRRMTRLFEIATAD